MTVYRTFGAGGQHVDVDNLWAYLAALAPLGDDYEFKQVGNCTDSAWSVGAGVDFNERSVRIYCPWADCHQGDPTKGFRITVNNNTTLAFRPTATVIANRLILDGLYFDRTDGNNTNIVDLATWNAGGTARYTLNNLIFRGIAANLGRGIRCFQDSNQRFDFSNIKMALLAQGINTQISAGVGGGHTMENISIDDCGEGIGWAAANRVWNIRNCVCTNCVTQGWGTAGAGSFLYNCADDDGSLGASGAALTDCIQNIVSANEFQSTNIASSNWLKLNDGTIT